MTLLPIVHCCRLTCGENGGRGEVGGGNVGQTPTYDHLHQVRLPHMITYSTPGETPTYDHLQHMRFPHMNTYTK
jgi:hypothetical protein